MPSSHHQTVYQGSGYHLSVLQFNLTLSLNTCKHQIPQVSSLSLTSDSSCKHWVSSSFYKAAMNQGFPDPPQEGSGLGAFEEVSLHRCNQFLTSLPSQKGWGEAESTRLLVIKNWSFWASPWTRNYLLGSHQVFLYYIKRDSSLPKYFREFKSFVSGTKDSARKLKDFFRRYDRNQI